MTQEKKLNPFQKFLRTGVHADTSFIETQRVYMFNLFILIGSPFAILSLIINLIHDAYFPALVNVAQLFSFCTAFWIAVKGKYKELRLVILISLTALSMIASYIYHNSGEYRFLLMILAAIILFDKDWHYLIYAMSTALVFVFLRLSYTPDLSQLPVPEIIATGLKMFLPLLLFILALLYFKTIYFKNLYQLENANMELRFAKDQKDRILGTVAHDLRTPISNISGIAKLMQSESLSKEDQQKFFSMIDQASHSALMLINDLLQHNNSTERNGDQKMVELNQQLSEWYPAFEFRAREKSIRVNIQYCVEELPVLIDIDRIERVMANLVTNAVKFSKEQSEIIIHTSKEPNYAVIAVTDHGIGIPKEKQENIFDLFGHSKRNGTAGEKGFGMGLSICKQIVEQHKGTITVESEEGKGTVFYVKIPLA
ncbi:sensor histidine kinase [Sediminibacterium goheungense]|uniref:histidine kinase n=1 Tax=Sediminibacterium goheungense TaxID=1086393 RepID=A0A4R6J042_9BACT|nr:HAMP domain-containing sensor histidine kinase [Sediminibacterium goheungense]TDO28554.1 signal transduction histidine kinase [Sediminibacterium goheungense]